MLLLRTLLVAVTASLVAVGCTTPGAQPEFQNAMISPDELQPGDTALVTVAVRDKHGIIQRIEGVVQEDPRITFKLTDDGEGVDEKAGDGVWSLGVDVPFQAPPGEFILDLTAYRDDGLPVSVRDDSGNVVPLSGSVPLIIRYGQEQP